MESLDDTQPRSPFKTPPTVRELQGAPPLNMPPEEDEGDAGGPGCWLWGFVVVFMLLLAVAIVLFAGAAGWTEGQRQADRHATATRAQLVNEQLARIPTDIADGNQRLIQVRLDFLATLTPGVPAVVDLRQTATAVYLNAQPTPTLTPTATLEITAEETTPPPEITEDIAPTANESGYDLAQLLTDAQREIALGEYEDAYETLDLIVRIDPNYQRTTVRGLINQALTTRATTLYRTEQTLAEAIRLTDLAEEYGSIGELDYERLIAGLYLDAKRATGTGDHAKAISSINQIRNNYQTSYLGIDLNRMLFNELVLYADAWAIGGQHCQAVTYYNQALTLFNDNGIIAKRDNSQLICEQGTPTPGPEGLEGQPTIAPVGQPGT
jgi:hypothetical protein